MIIRGFVAVWALLSSVSTAYILDGKEIPDVGRRAEEKDANAPLQTRRRELWPTNPNPNCNTFIDFDEVAAPCLFVQTVPLSTEYASEGVLFSGPSGPGGATGGAVLDECGSFGVNGHSPPNFLAFNDNTIGLDPETLTFLTPVNYVEVFVGHSSPGTATIECFLLGNSVGSSSVAVGPTLTSLDFGGPIFDSCEISATNAAWVLDDMCFNRICTGGISTSIDSDEYAVANGNHFHSSNGGAFGNPPDVLEIGQYSSETVYGLAEADITGEPSNVGLATVACSVRQRAGLFPGVNNFIANDFNINVYTYDGNNVEDLSDFSAVPLAFVGSFNTAGLNPGDQVSFDVTASYVALAGTDSLGIRMEHTEDTNGGAITLEHCELLLSCQQACCPKYITDSIVGDQAVYFPANGCEGFVACFNTQYQPPLLNFGYQACPTPPQLLWDGTQCVAPGAAPATCSDPDEYCVIDNWTPPMPMMSCCSDVTFTGKKAITDCLGYVDCDQGQECAVIECPLGLLFDVGSQLCDWPAAVTCDETCMPAGNSDRRVLSWEDVGLEEHEHDHKLRGVAGH